MGGGEGSVLVACALGIPATIDRLRKHYDDSLDGLI